MTATKHKRKARKGLLPPVERHATKSKPSDQASPSTATANVTKKKQTAKAASPSQNHAVKSTTAKTADAKIDKHTCKKKGTLFGAAPSPSKTPEQHHKHKHKLASTHSTHDPQSRAQSQNKAPGNSKKTSKPSQAAPNVSTEARISKKKRRGRKGKGERSRQLDPTAAADAQATTESPANQGATGKSNWDRLKVQALEQSEALPPKPQHTHVGKKRRRDAAQHKHQTGKSLVWLAEASQGIFDGKLVPKSDDCSATQVVAVDCEMVGVGTNQGRKRDALARASLVNDAGNVLLDVWVRPKEKVTDFRYAVTGIHWSDLKDGITPEEASRRMHELTKDCVLVGHALHNDIKVLALQGTIPRHRIRDTALYPPLMGVREKTGKLFSRSLKHVVSEQLGIAIQKEEHDPIQDARAALYLYHRHRHVWEMKVSTGLLHQPGMRTSAKLTKGFRQQKRMRVDQDANMAAAPQPHAAQQLGDADATAGGSDDEFAPPDALAVARMRARLTGAEQVDHHADL